MVTTIFYRIAGQKVGKWEQMKDMSKQPLSPMDRTKPYENGVFRPLGNIEGKGGMAEGMGLGSNLLYLRGTLVICFYLKS